MSDHNELEQLSAYVDGELDASERAGLEAHVAGCAECTRALDAIRATLTDLATLPVPQLDAGSIAAIDDRIAAERIARRSFTRRRGWTTGAAAAGIVIALVAVVSVLQNGSDKSGSTVRRAESFDAALQDNSATNYTEESLGQALALLSSGATLEGEQVSPAFKGGAGAGTSDAGATRNAQLYSSFSGDADGRLSRCAAAVEKADPDLAPVRFEVARFKGQEAFVLFYERPRMNPTFAEVWVVRPSDCATLYFAQRHL